jgi:hypothetical protein
LHSQRQLLLRLRLQPLRLRVAAKLLSMRLPPPLLQLQPWRLPPLLESAPQQEELLAQWGRTRPHHLTLQ